VSDQAQEEPWKVWLIKDQTWQKIDDPFAPASHRYPTSAPGFEVDERWGGTFVSFWLRVFISRTNAVPYEYLCQMDTGDYTSIVYCWALPDLLWLRQQLLAAGTRSECPVIETYTSRGRVLINVTHITHVVEETDGRVYVYLVNQTEPLALSSETARTFMSTYEDRVHGLEF
jgi:hypothetical protein